MLNPKWTATFGTRICAICKTDFTARQHNAKYCSMTCYNKRLRKEYAMDKTGSQIEKSLRSMYELGVEHGRQLEQRDEKIRQLKVEVSKLAPTSEGIKADKGK